MTASFGGGTVVHRLAKFCHRYADRLGGSRVFMFQSVEGFEPYYMGRKEISEFTLFWAASLFLIFIASENALAGEKEMKEATKIVRQFLPFNSHPSAGKGYEYNALYERWPGVRQFNAKIYYGLPVTYDSFEFAVEDIERRSDESLGKTLASGTSGFKVYVNLDRAPHIQVWHRQGNWGTSGFNWRNGHVDEMIIVDAKNFQMVQLTPEDRIKLFGEYPTLRADQELHRIHFMDKIIAAYNDVAASSPRPRVIPLKEVTESLFSTLGEKQVYLAEDYMPAVILATRQAKDEVNAKKINVVSSWLEGNPVDPRMKDVKAKSFDDVISDIEKSIEDDVFFPMPPVKAMAKMYKCESLFYKVNSLLSGNTSGPWWKIW